MRMDVQAHMAMLVVAFRNFAKTPKNTILCTKYLVSLCAIFQIPFVFSWYLTPATENHRCSVCTFSSALCLIQEKHISAIGPTTLHWTHDIWTHCWSRTVRRRNICADHRAFQYCSGPCRNIRWKWTAIHTGFWRTGGLSGVALHEQQ
jgi:hypothetical protein